MTTADWLTIAAILFGAGSITAAIGSLKKAIEERKQ